MRVKVAAFISLVVVGCSRTPSTNEFIDALPSIAVTSPTAKVVSHNENAKVDSNNLVVKGSLGQIVQPVTSFFSGEATIGSTDEAPSLPAATVLLRQNAQLSIGKALKRMDWMTRERGVNCFGRALPYSKHPDGGPNSSTLGGESGFNTSMEWVNQTPVACPAAAMNQKVMQLGGVVNQALQLTYLSATALQEAGQRLPKNLGGTAGAKIPDAGVFENARVAVTRMGTDKRDITYLWEFSGILKNGSLRSPVQLWLTHTRSSLTRIGVIPERGRFWGVVPEGTDSNAFTLTYHIENGRTSYELKSTQTRAASNVLPSSFFDMYGMVSFEPSAFRQNLFHLVADLDSQSGLGKLKASWAATSKDPRARVFEISTERHAQSQDEGFAYFGYGPALTEKNLASKATDTAESMVCAWSAGKKSFLRTGEKAEHRGLVQAMKLRRNPATGQFEPMPGEEHIRYCPTQSCNGASGMTYGNSPCDQQHALARVNLYGKVSIQAPTYP